MYAELARLWTGSSPRGPPVLHSAHAATSAAQGTTFGIILDMGKYLVNIAYHYDQRGDLALRCTLEEALHPLPDTHRCSQTT